MIDLQQYSDKLIQQVPMNFQRSLLAKIDFKNRLIGIKGARGVGKTTLLLQKLQQLGYPASEAVYLPLDDLYFLSNTLVEIGKQFYQHGGKIMVLDEVHKYPNWAREIKILYDRYKDLKIIFTGSSIIDITRQEGDLSRRVLMYELHGLSYREYLQLNNIASLPVLDIKQIIRDFINIRPLFDDQFRPLAHFDDYLKFGYYPFYQEDKDGFHQRLRQMVRLIVEFDMAEINGFDIRNAKKILQLLNIIAQQVPFSPNLVKLSEKAGIHRNSIGNYMYFLEEARLLSLLQPSGISISMLQKPEKIFLNNTALMYALSIESPQIGSIRETFVNNQLRVSHQVTKPKAADFEVDGKLIFEVGGSGKGIKQISGIPKSYLIKDNIEYPVANAIPLWMIGMLY
jgi:uncharacterized protein